MLASVSTSLAELLGGAIALQMLFGVPVRIGAALVLAFVLIMLFTNSYRLIEKWIIAFVSIIGLSFIYELSLVTIDWPAAAVAWVTPSFPEGSMVIVMSVLGAVVMPHNLFLHSEVIQSRKWNLSDERTIRRQLRYEYVDTIFSMLVGWAINSAMILLAAATFFVSRTPVSELQQADSLLRPLLGSHATVVFAVALLLAGIASTITSGMAAGTIFAGMFREPYDRKDPHSRFGVALSLMAAFVVIIVISDPFKGLIYSQMALSIQLPFTVFLQVRLTSSEKVMGKFRNSRSTKWLLYAIGALVTWLNVMIFGGFRTGIRFLRARFPGLSRDSSPRDFASCFSRKPSGPAWSDARRTKVVPCRSGQTGIGIRRAARPRRSLCFVAGIIGERVGRGGY